MLGGLARLLEAFNTKGIDIYEWKQADIRKARLPNGPVWSNFTTPHPQLQFTGWRLAHAVVKVDYLNERDLLLPGIGFILQAESLIDFAASPNFSLIPGSPAMLNDFTRTSLTGRLGQGLSLLFAQERGYSFACHLASDPIVKSHVASLSKKSQKIADFLFEGFGGQRMILESKASFAQTTNDPIQIKSTLKAALVGQVDFWMPRIVPAASKGFAVYSCLRESRTAVRSALIFVDPPEQPLRDPIELPQSQIRRHNYAAWLRLMGLSETSRDLLHRERSARRIIDLPIIRVGSNIFAASVQLSHNKLSRWMCAALDVDAIKAISAALDGNDELLLAYNGLDPRTTELLAAVEEAGSIFPDGSYFGTFDEISAFEGFMKFYL